MEKMINVSLLVVMSALALPAWSTEVCTVSMMGRVCYEEGSAELTAAHMKTNAVADAAKKAQTEVADASKVINSKKK